jgi:hypothetical protein
MKRAQVIAAWAAVMAGLLVAGVGVSAALADPGNGPPSSPPGQGECQHGNSGQECKPDPQPEHGKECQDHGNLGGVNEDHCLGTTDSTPTTETTTPDQTTSSSTPTTTDETTTTNQPTTTDDATTTSAPTTTTTAQPTAQVSTNTSITTTDVQSSEDTGSGAFTPPAVRPSGQQTTPGSPATNSSRHEVLSKQTKVEARSVSEGKAKPGELPFTGFPTWMIAGLGLLLLAGGLVIRRLTL